MKNILLRMLECFSRDLRQKTGEKAEVSGIFRNGKQYIPLSRNETIPPHKGHKEQCWKLVVEL